MGWRDGVFAAAVLAAGLSVACVSVRATAQEPTPSAIHCGGEMIARGMVGHVIDGRTLALDDGREVRLAAVEVPPDGPALPGAANSLPGAANALPGASKSKTALDALVGGDEVVLRRAELPSDRYGRLVAYAYAVRDGEELFAQGELISAGLARVGDRIGSRACAEELLGREAAARKAKLGLWAEPYYDVLNAETPADVLAQQGRFALVEGKVVSVRESGATIYVNFGHRWSEEFTVTVLKRNERNFAAAGLDLKRLEGRRVRVRGWIEERGSTGTSPWIEAVHPEQIEIADRD